MTAINLEAEAVQNTPYAKRISNVYTLSVLGAIVITALVPAPYGSISAVVIGVLAVIGGAVVRRIAKKETQYNSIAKLGVSLSFVWIGMNILALGVLALANAALPFAQKVIELVR